MDADKEKSPGSSEVGDKPAVPPAGAQVWVQCEGFRTLAYRDAKGKWRTVSKGEELKGVVTVIKEE
jgi:GH24 family phage-related lysozyme (muramidase)